MPPFTIFSMLSFQSCLFRGGFRPGCRLSGILSPLRRRMSCLPPCARALDFHGRGCASTGCLLRLFLRQAFRLFPPVLILTLAGVCFPYPALLPSGIPFFHIPVEIIIIQIALIRIIQIIFIFQHNLPAVHRRISSHRLPPIFAAAGT